MREVRQAPLFLKEAMLAGATVTELLREGQPLSFQDKPHPSQASETEQHIVENLSDLIREIHALEQSPNCQGLVVRGLNN